VRRYPSRNSASVFMSRQLSRHGTSRPRYRCRRPASSWDPPHAHCAGCFTRPALTILRHVRPLSPPWVAMLSDDPAVAQLYQAPKQMRGSDALPHAALAGVRGLTIPRERVQLYI
jgi:hypothetical protein